MAKPRTIADILKRELELQCENCGIEYKRKQGGLSLMNVFGCPSLQPSDTEIRIVIIAGTIGFMGGKRQYHTLHFTVGDAANPKADPQAACDKVMATVMLLKQMELFADKVDIGGVQPKPGEPLMDVLNDE